MAQIRREHAHARLGLRARKAVAAAGIFMVFVLGSIGALAKELGDKGFAQCNSCYLVNLQHVREVSGYMLRLSDGSELKISQPRKKAFTEIFRAYRAGQQKDM